MIPAATQDPIKVAVSDRSVFGLGETFLRMILSAAIPISAVVFVVLTF